MAATRKKRRNSRNPRKATHGLTAARDALLMILFSTACLWLMWTLMSSGERWIH